MEAIKILFIILVLFFLCAAIYAVLSWFKRTVKTNILYDKYIEKLDNEYNQLLDTIEKTNNDCTVISTVKTDDDTMYDKTDEELLEDWNNLWGGNPPCELDLKAIREEEKRERGE